MLNFKNILIGLYVCIYMLFCNYRPLHGDTIYLKDSNKGIPVETTEMGMDDITVSISKNAIYSTTITFNNSNDYPDEVVLKNKTKVQCKMVEILDKKIKVSFPRNAVKSLQMDISKEKVSYRQQNYEEGTTELYIDNDDVREKESYRDDLEQTSLEQASSDDDFLGLVMLEDELKEEDSEEKMPAYNAKNDIKMKLLSEIQKAKSKKKSGGQTGGLDLLDKTLRSSNAIAKKELVVENSDSLQNTNVGKVKGRFLRKGNPLASCRVRLVKLRKEGVAYYKDIENTRPLEVITDRYGTYLFENVPPGFHKLYWKPPMESSWIRRVSMEPDVLMKAGEVAYLDDIETNQRILN